MKTGQVITRKVEAVGKIVNTPVYVAKITPADLRQLREQLGQMRGKPMSQAEFGRELALVTNPKAQRKDWYSRQYISAMEAGKPNFAITPQIEAAYWILIGNLDGVIPGALSLHQVTVLTSIEGQIPENTYIPIGAKVAKCALPGCPVHFLKTNPFQKYHSAECKARAAEMRRKLREGN